MTDAVSSVTPAQPRWFERYALLVVLLAGIVAYANSFGSVFVLDDLSSIAADPAVRRGDVFGAAVGDLGRPLTQASFALCAAVNAELGRPLLDPGTFHAFNLAVHLAAAATLYALISVGVQGTNGRWQWLPLAVALLWVVHPLTTQAVTYVVQRAEAMMALGVMLAVLCTARGAIAGRAAVAWRWYAAAVVAMVLSVGAKQVGVATPAVVLLFDRAYLAGSWRTAIARRWPLYFLLASVAMAALAVQREAILGAGAGADASAGFGVTIHTPWTYALTQTGVLLHYLRLVVLPHPLVVDYDWPATRFLQDALPQVIAVLLIAAATTWTLWRHPKVGVLPAIAFAILMPTSSIVPIADVVVEHRMYLPLAPVLALLLIAGWTVLRRMGGRPAPIVAAAVVGLATLTLAGRTIVRNQDYGTSVRFWESEVRHAPGNRRAQHNYANALVQEGRPDNALPIYERLLSEMPANELVRTNYARALDALGVVHARAGRFEDAARTFSRVIAERPDAPDGYRSLGMLAYERSDLAGAERLLAEAAARVDSPDADLQNILGLSLARQGKVAEAAAAFGRAVAADPDHADAAANLDRARRMLAEQPQPAPAPSRP